MRSIVKQTIATTQQQLSRLHIVSLQQQKHVNINSDQL